VKEITAYGHALAMGRAIYDFLLERLRSKRTNS
jgi:hypothetical protein